MFKIVHKYISTCVCNCVCDISTPRRNNKNKETGPTDSINNSREFSGSSSPRAASVCNRCARASIFSFPHDASLVSSFFVSSILKEHHRHESDGLLTNRNCRGRPRPQHYYFGKRRWRASGASRRRNRNGRDKVGLDGDS